MYVNQMVRPRAEYSPQRPQETSSMYSNQEEIDRLLKAFPGSKLQNGIVTSGMRVSGGGGGGGGGGYNPGISARGSSVSAKQRFNTLDHNNFIGRYNKEMSSGIQGINMMSQQVQTPMQYNAYRSFQTGGIQ